jgi:DNA-directed RNA polymerase specialized sigma24 family protein
MSPEIQLQQMTVADLAQRCAQETDLYFHQKEHDPSYCFELVRRAIRDNDKIAFEVIITQYEALVARWVNKWMGKHPDFLPVNEEAQDFVAQAFERFWISFTPAKLDKSQSLAAVLSYLQTCVHGALMDAWRKWRRGSSEEETNDELQRLPETSPTPEDIFQTDEFWQLIRKKCKDSKEFTVVFASFSLSLSPRQIFAEYPGLFRDIQEIYQYKTNLMDRLRRDEEFREFVRGQ